MSSTTVLSNNPSSDGFLNGCIEASVEMPPDGLDGKEINSTDHWKDGVEYTEVVHPGSLCENDDMKHTTHERELCNMIISGRVDSGVATLLYDSSFCVSDIVTGNTNGVIQLNRRFFSVNWLNDTYKVIMVDMDSKEMAIYENGKRVDVQYALGVIDLDASGNRWEGGVKDGKPFGYGTYFNEDGKKEYEGWLMDGMKTCCGIETYSDIESVKYDGCYCNDNRFGKGILYDLKGGVGYDGLWKDNEPYSPHFDGRTVDNRTESIEIPSNSFSELESFILPSFIHLLKWIVIGNDCFGSVRLFELDGLNELESVVIGEKSFTCIKEDSYYGRPVRITEGACRIVNCCKLRSIQLNNDSFFDYHSFELQELPSLQSIDIGWDCFMFSPSFSLTGFTDSSS